MVEGKSHSADIAYEYPSRNVTFFPLSFLSLPLIYFDPFGAALSVYLVEYLRNSGWCLKNDKSKLCYYELAVEG